MKKVFVVVRPLGRSRELVLLGSVVSRHETYAAAEAAIAAENEAVRRCYGPGHWVEREVLVEDDGETRFPRADETV